MSFLSGGQGRLHAINSADVHLVQYIHIVYLRLEWTRGEPQDTGTILLEAAGVADVSPTYRCPLRANRATSIVPQEVPDLYYVFQALGTPVWPSPGLRVPRHPPGRAVLPHVHYTMYQCINVLTRNAAFSTNG